MRISIAGVLAGIALPLLLNGDSPRLAARERSSVDQQVRELTRRWDEAQQRRDTETLGHMLVDDFTYTDANGNLLTRSQYLMSVVKAPDVATRTYTTSELSVRVYGDVAVAAGRSSWKGGVRGKGQFVDGRYRFTDVWIKRKGRWEAVATHGTSIVP